MKQLSLIILFSLLSSISIAQEIELTESELKTKLDSVLYEGNLLYFYERAAWISSDLALAIPSVKDNFYSYISYRESNGIRTIFLGKELQTCIAEYTFEGSFEIPPLIKIEKRDLSDKEKILVEVREKILNNLSSKDYKVIIPEGYNLNFVLLPFGEKYKLYILTGTTKPNIIPFGNDYLFIADKTGEIESWHKFHSRLIPMEIEEKHVGLMHTHLPTTPLITATDICTFMLNAPYFVNIDCFSVYSPAIDKIMKYCLKDNKITIEKDF